MSTLVCGDFSALFGPSKVKRRLIALAQETIS